LGQALFDEMKDDFEIALREEALSDGSVKKQIQPMISLFYDRVKKYAEALNQPNPQESVLAAFSETLKVDAQESRGGANEKVFSTQISSYLLAFDETLSKLSIGEIALTHFEFPKLPS